MRWCWSIASMPELASLTPAQREELLRSVDAGRATTWMLVRALAIGALAGLIPFAILKSRVSEDQRVTLIAAAIAGGVVVALIAFQIMLQRLRSAVRRAMDEPLSR